MDQKNKVKVLQKEIVLKYVVALSLIAIISTLTFYTMYSVLKESDNTAEIVNISGKQRMLSQHIALDIHRIHSGFLDKTTLDTHNNDLERQILKSHTQEMLDANKRLSTGILSPTNKYVLSTTIQEMYFGDINLAHRVAMYIQIAEKSFRINDHDTIHQLVKQIDSLSEPLLRDLNKVVQQYQKEGEEKLANMQVLETAAWIATIIILLLEVIFIFQPMVRRIIFLQSENDSVLQHLEDTIEIRTMHLEKANDKLKHLAFHDALTGLRNRLNLEQDIEHAIEMNKEHNSPYAVLMFDIDWFKRVNDEFGHDVGDEVLKEVSSTFLSIVRNEDKVYRAGGEEFVVLLNRISYESTIDIAEKIRLTIQKHKFHADDKEFFKTISCGLYHSSIMKGLDVTSVLKLADTALYKSKTNGRNRVTSVSEDLIKPTEEKLVPSMEIIFQDKTFNQVLDIEVHDNFELFCNYENLFENKVSFIKYVHPEDVSIFKDFHSESSQESPHISTIRMYDTNGKIRIYRVKLYTQGQNCGVSLEESINIATTVSDSVLVQNLQAMLENTDDYIYFKDRNHVFTAASKTLSDLASVDTRDQLVGKTDYDVFDNEYSDIYFKLERQVFDGELDVAQEFQPIMDNEGNKGLVDNRKYPIHDADGKTTGLFGIARIVKS